MAFLALLVITAWWHLVTDPEAPGKRESREQLLRGDFNPLFTWGVMGAGTVLPALLAVIAIAAPDVRDAMVVIALPLVVAAGFALRLVTLRVGIFPPVRAPFPVRQLDG